MSKTLEEVRLQGLSALRKELGRAGMIRFLQQFDAGKGDYATSRKKWTGSLSLAEIRVRAKRRK